MARELNFVWQGGEPLLAEIGFYKQVIAIQQRYASEGVTISNSLQTNATLLNDAWCRLFRVNNFIIGSSLEVLYDVHNHHPRAQRCRAAHPSVFTVNHFCTH